MQQHVKIYINIAVAYVKTKKERKEKIITVKELRRILFDSPTPLLGTIFRHLEEQGLVKKIRSSSYEILK